jgi:hypothetical protein
MIVGILLTVPLWASSAQESTNASDSSAPPPALSPASLPGMQPAAAVKTYVPRPGLNEMQGKLVSRSDDPKTLRLLVDGGFNVEFTYDAQTRMVNGGSPITINDLNYSDVVIVRYSGMDLYAVELDRLSKAARPQ